MKKINIFAIIFILVVSLGNSANVFAIEENQSHSNQIIVKLLDENQNPLPSTYIMLYTLLEWSTVDSGVTDKNGEIILTYQPQFASGANVLDVDFGIYAAPKDSELVSHHFTQTYIKDKTLYSDEEINNYLSNNTEYVELILKEEHRVNILKIDSRSNKIKEYLVKAGKLTPKNPIYTINGQDRKEMLVKGILKPEEVTLGLGDNMTVNSDITALADVTHNLGSFLTTVGEVHSIDGISSTFKFSRDSGVKIDVATKTGAAGSWGVSGSLIKKAGWDIVWPAFTTTSSSGFGKQARTYFQYHMDETYSYYTGNVSYKVYPTTFNGGTAWGNSLYGLDGASASSISSGSLGSDWASYLPGSSATRGVSAGRSFSGAATISIPALSSSVSLGSTTSYNTSTTITYNFSSKYSKYYIYGRGSSWKTIYVSNSSR